MVTQLELLGLATTGANLDISAIGRSQFDLLGIATAGKAKGAKLILRDASAISQFDRLGIASASPGNITFVL